MATKQIIKVGISGLVFDSITPKKILLIRREQPPYQNLWSFPGGKLEFGELIADGIKREVLEETGYSVDLINNQYNINEIIKGDTHYLIHSACCVIQNYTQKHEQIHSQFFYLDQYYGNNKNEMFNLSEIKEIESIPNLQFIIKNAMKLHFNIKQLQQ